MKLNGWLQIALLLLGLTGLISWVITADNRLHHRCDTLEVRVEKSADTVNKNYVELIELKGDVKLIREILERQFPKASKEAKNN